MSDRFMGITVPWDEKMKDWEEIYTDTIKQMYGEFVRILVDRKDGGDFAEWINTTHGVDHGKTLKETIESNLGRAIADGQWKAEWPRAIIAIIKNEMTQRDPIYHIRVWIPGTWCYPEEELPVTQRIYLHPTSKEWEFVKKKEMPKNLLK